MRVRAHFLLPVSCEWAIRCTFPLLRFPSEYARMKAIHPENRGQKSPLLLVMIAAIIVAAFILFLVERPARKPIDKVTMPVPVKAPKPL